MSALHFFLWLNNIPLCGETSVCLSIHLLTDIQVTSTFWLSGIVVLWTFVHKDLSEQFFWVILKSGMAGSYGNSVFNFLKNHHTMSHSGYTILRSHQVLVLSLFSRGKNKPSERLRRGPKSRSLYMAVWGFELRQSDSRILWITRPHSLPGKFSAFACGNSCVDWGMMSPYTISRKSPQGSSKVFLTSFFFDGHCWGSGRGWDLAPLLCTTEVWATVINASLATIQLPFSDYYYFIRRD